ncbi:hypothetical protein PBI_COLTRANE_35 [Microbacterium phage Coltrane]|uniref:Uncharacterized protein n=6 Tax=Armstrongvirus armstrong TaxID=2734217 RepID=A0A3G2KDC5_9CAUD|nr:hypothetical protein HOU45_gp35 [Microbacterium phage Armstrong]AYN55906.1 hypothetical protein PBI_BRAHMS_35 [Microbacterium phage Brahms]AYN57012.1 hypothetical protein PBI_BERNSTEIN_35 [Microbacterium phage Bernstein]AYN57371.1 hypothetical protein PBI_COLTRANE_35 [Microbacterium phage Coltrane]AYN58959.1 hypothetical protein PBI_ROLLINS_35 [Microbacterium phage Rollins]QED11458.1 hypothetical protein SEA_VITAS_35 [Microbacterium phage Vitas]UGL62002.1 hypothetical protein SEA_SKYLORD_3
MNKINHNDSLDFINSVEHIAHHMTTEELQELDSTKIALQAIETVDNCVDAIRFIELAITAHGYEIRYIVAEGYDYGQFEVLSDLEHALEMIREDLLED